MLGKKGWGRGAGWALTLVMEIIYEHVLELREIPTDKINVAFNLEGAQLDHEPRWLPGSSQVKTEGRESNDSDSEGQLCAPDICPPCQSTAKLSISF